jgi:hypothetical protein
MNPPLIAAAVLLYASAGQALASDFAWAIPIEPRAGGSFLRVQVPAHVYEIVTRADLGDLCVLNGAGERVPHALLPRRAGLAPARHVEAKPFALRARPAVPVENLDLRIEAGASGTLVKIGPAAGSGGRDEVLRAHLIDLSGVAFPVDAVELVLAEPDRALSSSVTVEASDDLTGWRVLASGAPVLNLVAAERRLTRLRIEFPPQQMKYLRLRWADAEPAPELSAVRVERAPQQRPPQRQWKAAVVAALQGHPGEYALALGGRHPTDRVRIPLAEPNAVVPVEVLTRTDATAPWRSLGSATLYTLLEGGREVRNTELSLSAAPAQDVLLRVDTRGGGFGRAAPTVEFGWVPHELIAVARGPGPFRLAYGSRSAPACGYPLETLIPGDAPQEPGTAARIEAAVTGAPLQLAGEAALRPRIEPRRVVLWAALVGGVLLLALMAWRLWRQTSARREADEKDCGPPDQEGDRAGR